VPAQPLEGVRAGVESGRAGAFDEGDPPGAGASGGTRVVWNVEAVERLSRVPSFVRGMVKRIYTDWAKQRGITEITPAVMDRARIELGLEGM
ncbi:MAG: PCP reductase family protein, partial [Gemmatimonadota bacterium]